MDALDFETSLSVGGLRICLVITCGFGETTLSTEESRAERQRSEKMEKMSTLLDSPHRLERKERRKEKKLWMGETCHDRCCSGYLCCEVSTLIKQQQLISKDVVWTHSVR